MNPDCATGTSPISSVPTARGVLRAAGELSPGPSPPTPGAVEGDETPGREQCTLVNICPHTRGVCR